jgi:hypothetical protein
MKAQKTRVRPMKAGPPKRSSFEDFALLPAELPSLWQWEDFPLVKLEEYPLQLPDLPLPTLEAYPLQLNDYPLQLLSPDDYPLRLLSFDDLPVQSGDEPVSVQSKRRTPTRNKSPGRAVASSRGRQRRT